MLITPPQQIKWDKLPIAPVNERTRKKIIMSINILAPNIQELVLKIIIRPTKNYMNTMKKEMSLLKRKINEKLNNNYNELLKKFFG
jgi:hypothetical protein